MRISVPFYIIAFFWSAGLSAQPLLYNGGAEIQVQSTAYIYVQGGVTNDVVGGNNGIFHNVGTIYLSGDWANNVSNYALDPNTGTVELNGNSQNINGSQSTKFNNLSLTGSAGSVKTLNVYTFVGGTTGILSLGSDVFMLNSNTCEVTNSATGAITRSTGYIQSETNLAVNPSIVKWNMSTVTGTFIFPFGVSGTYIPFSFNKTSGGAANISVSTRATAGSDNMPYAGAGNVGAVTEMTGGGTGATAQNSVIDRWWEITKSAAVTADITFTYRGSENTTGQGAGAGLVAAQHWTGSTWDTFVGSGDAVTSGTATVTATAQTTFSPWILVYKTKPLPVELLTFDAAYNKKTGFVDLVWTTASETNNDYFTVERSSDNLNFETVITRNGAGNSNQVLYYYDADKEPLPGLSYYRLKQTDFDGAFTYSQTETVMISSENYIVTINPNPVNDHINVSVISHEQQCLKLKFFDIYGNLLKETNMDVLPGGNLKIIPAETFAPGVYFMRIDGTMVNIKFVIEK